MPALQVNARVDHDNVITFLLSETWRDQVVAELRHAALDSLEGIGDSLLDQRFFDLVVPMGD